MIYIVEDDASIRELEQYALQTNQYTVRGFEDGASFWAAVRETVPDLVILDVGPPAGDRRDPHRTSHHGHSQNQRD